MKLDLGAGETSPEGYPAIVGSHALSELPKERGIYAVMLWPLSRFYVGSSNNIRERCGDHLSRLRNGSHKNRPLQEAWDRNGARSFLWFAIQSVRGNDVAELLAAEKRHIELLRSFEPFGGFNRNGDPINGSLAETTRAKLRAIMTERHPSRGKKRSLAIRAKNSAVQRALGARSSEFKGVHIDRRTRTFMARIFVAGRALFLGRYATAVEAAQAYNNAALKHYGSVCYLNPVPDGLPTRRTIRGRPSMEAANG